VTTERQAGRGFQEGVADMESACPPSKEEKKKKKSDFPPRYIKMFDAEAYCSVSRWTIQKWVLEKGLCRHTVGRSVFFDVKDLDAFMEKYKE